MSYNKIDVELDAKGKFCPMPIVMLQKASKKACSGQIIKLEATDPGSKRDVPAWARKTGNTILETKEDGDVLTFIIKVA
jgi:tRNA 2-thiouridine synthesizing protein A